MNSLRAVFSFAVSLSIRVNIELSEDEMGLSWSKLPAFGISRAMLFVSAEDPDQYLFWNLAQKNRSLFFIQLSFALRLILSCLGFSVLICCFWGRKKKKKSFPKEYIGLTFKNRK